MAQERHTKPRMRVVEVPNSNYQPTKAEKEETIILRRKNGTPPTPRELASSLRPVEVVYVDKPRKS